MFHHYLQRFLTQLSVSNLSGLIAILPPSLSSIILQWPNIALCSLLKLTGTIRIFSLQLSPNPSDLYLAITLSYSASSPIHSFSDLISIVQIAGIAAVAFLEKLFSLGLWMSQYHVFNMVGKLLVFAIQLPASNIHITQCSICFFFYLCSTCTANYHIQRWLDGIIL